MRLHGAIDLTQIKHTWKGNWEPSEVYYLNDVVKYRGLSFVCVTTNLSDEQRYGLEYQPTVANEYWDIFSQGYLNKGQWEYKQYYYPGDVVQYNEDWYLCNTYNFGGHPIYENGGLSSKWTLIAKSPLENRSRNHLWLSGYGPMGWTRNYCENNDQFWTQEIQGFSTIDGNYCKTYIGRFTSTYYHGTGEANPVTLYHPSRPGYDFWDYYDGYRPSITGGTPRCIQVATSWYNQFMLFDNGEVYATGYGGNGQNGDGTNTNYNYVRRVGRSTGGRGTGVLRDVFIVKLAPSYGNSHTWSNDYQHVLALDSNGGVWSWGYGGYGCLGHGDSIGANNIPRLINKKYFDNSRIVDIWAVGTGSYQTSYALDENGQLWAWGYGGYGQLGIDEYFTNTGGAIDQNARPQKVSIDFTDYGGLKKIMFSGASTAKTIVALTNDNQLWGWGYSSYAAAWGAGANATVIGRPRQLQRLIYEQAKSLGKNGTRNVGSSIDVANNAEDFWLDSNNGYETLFIKEKNTNLMFGLGYQYNNAMPLTDQAGEVAQNTDATVYNVTTSYPTLLSIGDANDIKYMIKHAAGVQAREYYFLNRDGRVFNSGSTTGITAKGIGLNYTTEPHAKAAKLPWEGDLNAGTAGVTQVRWRDKFNMITGYYDGGFGGITKNNRFVFLGPANATYQLFPYAGEVTNNTQAMHNPVRLGYF